MLDGLAVTSDLVHDILIDPSYSVRILSLLECKHLNERKLCGALQYACRASRPEGTPRLQGMYIFGKKALPAPQHVPEAGACAGGADRQLAIESEPWYGRGGQQFPSKMYCIHPEWALTLVACDGIIAFDTVLCTGPRHLNSRAWGKVNVGASNSTSSAHASPHWAVATYSLDGCAGCGSAPEGWTVWGDQAQEENGGRDRAERRDSDGCSPLRKEIGRFPLLRQAPMHSANVKVAMCPSDQPLNPHLATSTLASPGKAAQARFIPRCYSCLRDRHCSACNRWWCESCYTVPSPSQPAAQQQQANQGANAASGTPPSNGSNGVGGVGDPELKVRSGVCVPACFFVSKETAPEGDS